MRLAIPILPFVPLICCSMLAAQQDQFREIAKNYLPQSTDLVSALVLGDVDGDGDLDLVVGNYGTQNRLYRNDGDVFTDVTAAQMPADREGTSSLALGDVDGDGDLDLVLGNAGQARLYLNDGKGRFTDATATRLPVRRDWNSTLVLSDVDGDGDLDLIIGNTRFPYQNRLYVNDGKGSFTDMTATSMPKDVDPTSSISVGDVDGDGDIDLVLANYNNLDRLYLNDGKGHFTDMTAGRLPDDKEQSYAALLGDVDGDGDLDLVLVNSAYRNRLYLNDGKGRFTDVSASQMPRGGPHNTVGALVDFDGDGDLDLILGLAQGQQNLLFLNDGKGSFSDVTANNLPAAPDWTVAIAVGDLDGDRDQDVIFCNGTVKRQNVVYVNNGKASFTSLSATGMPKDQDNTNAIAYGDVDGDGNLDLVLGIDTNVAKQDRLYLGDGNGGFTDVTKFAMPKVFGRTTAVVLEDVDRDGDLDLVTALAGPYAGRPNTLFLGNGKGSFTDVTSARMPGLSNNTTSLLAGDVDGDGDLDLVLGNSPKFRFGHPPSYYEGENRLYLNNGSGKFTNSVGAIPQQKNWTVALALGDIDRDGDVDIVFGNYGQQNRLYLNDSRGRFSDKTTSLLPADNDRTSAIILVDIDGDGDLDLVLANNGSRNRLYLNDGRGRFTDASSSRLPADTDQSTDVTFGDVDGDGDPDLVFSAMGLNRLYLNNGKGFFSDVTRSRLARKIEKTQALALADFDQDGDLDLVLAIHGPNRLLANFHRQTYAPGLARLGARYALEIYALPGYATAAQAAIPFISPAKLVPKFRVPPFGFFGLSPATLLALPALGIGAPKGRASIQFMIPNVKVLKGQAFYFQSLILHSSSSADWRLTNVFTDTIR